MSYGEPRTQERLFSLTEIISATGHARPKSAYELLRRHGQNPTHYRPARRAPVGVYPESVVRKVFASHLDRAARITGKSVKSILDDVKAAEPPQRSYLQDQSR